MALRNMRRKVSLLALVCMSFIFMCVLEPTDYIEMQNLLKRSVFNVSNTGPIGCSAHIAEVCQRQSAVYDLIHEGDPTTSLTRHEVINSHREDFLCLRHHIQQNSSTHLNASCEMRANNETLVPKIALYVIFGDIKFKFIHYLSVRSVQRSVKADRIYVVGYPEPKGRWWDKAMATVAALKYVSWQKPSYIYGQMIPGNIYVSDVVRHQILLALGGIYLDTDILFTKDIEPLRGHDVTMGFIDSASGLGNGLILTKPGTEFLSLWYKSYRVFDPVKNYFGRHSMQVPYELSKIYPDLVHVEHDSFYRPGWHADSKQMLYAGHYDWNKNYAVHLWSTPTNITFPTSETDVDQLDTTLGEIVRFILYGISDMILPSGHADKPQETIH